MRYVVAVQRVGHGDTGVLAITVFAEALPPRDDEGGDDRPLPTALMRSGPNDSVTQVYSDYPDSRWDDVRALVDTTMAAAVAGFAQQLGRALPRTFGKDLSCDASSQPTPTTSRPPVPQRSIHPASIR